MNGVSTVVVPKVKVIATVVVIEETFIDNFTRELMTTGFPDLHSAQYMYQFHTNELVTLHSKR